MSKNRSPGAAATALGAKHFGEREEHSHEATGAQDRAPSAKRSSYPLASLKAKWVEAVLCDRELSDGAKVTGLVLAWLYINWGTHTAWPAQSTLAKRVHKSPRAIRSHIRELEDRGYLASRQSEHRRTLEYRLLLPELGNGGSREKEASGE